MSFPATSSLPARRGTTDATPKRAVSLLPRGERARSTPPSTTLEPSAERKSWLGSTLNHLGSRFSHRISRSSGNLSRSSSDNSGVEGTLSQESSLGELSGRALRTFYLETLRLRVV